MRVLDRVTASKPLVLVLLLTVGCGGALEGAMRSAALAHRSTLSPERRFLGCEADDIEVEAQSAMQVWTRPQGWWHLPPPDGAVTDPETGDLVSLPLDLPTYYVASCRDPIRHCYWPEVLLGCEAERCEVIADNDENAGMLDCPAY